jgi:hypothetical protein
VGDFAVALVTGGDAENGGNHKILDFGFSIKKLLGFSRIHSDIVKWRGNAKAQRGKAQAKRLMAKR